MAYRTVALPDGRLPSYFGLMVLPFLHDGRAATLRDRFAPDLGGGDMHGEVSQLSDGEIEDLVAYLESL